MMMDRRANQHGDVLRVHAGATGAAASAQARTTQEHSTATPGRVSARVGAGPDRRTGKRSGRQVLTVIASLLALSAALRLGIGIDVALAQAGRSEPGSEAAAAPVTAPGDLAVATALIAELRDREATLVQREAALSDRMQALSVAEDRVAARIAELEGTERRLAATLARAEGASEADITRLVSVYEAMRPEQAAALFAEMAPDFAAGFLARMRPEAAAAVLAGLEPRTAYSMSVILAGRHARVPRE
jgi:flagellar motility protein MotE (MotC chaperone)